MTTLGPCESEVYLLIIRHNRTCEDVKQRGHVQGSSLVNSSVAEEKGRVQSVHSCEET